MPTLPTSILSKPLDGERIKPETLAYMRARAKRHAYDLVMTEFKRSGITKAELARRLFGQKGKDQVSRMLGGPGNWTIKTLSDLLFAISAAEPSYSLTYPLDRAPRGNYSSYAKYLDEVPESETYSITNDSKVTLKQLESAE